MHGRWIEVVQVMSSSRLGISCDEPSASAITVLQLVIALSWHSVVQDSAGLWFFFCRIDCFRGDKLWPHDPYSDHRLSSVFFCGVSHPAGGACHRARGRHGVIQCGTSSTGSLPSGGSHQEDQGWTAGKLVQTSQGHICRDAEKDYC